jgi:hypothetical protein
MEDDPDMDPADDLPWDEYEVEGSVRNPPPDPPETDEK